MKLRLVTCLPCLNVCPQCRHAPLERRREMALTALMILGIRDREEEPPDQDNGEPDDNDSKGRLPGLNLAQVAAHKILPPPLLQDRQLPDPAQVVEKP